MSPSRAVAVYIFGLCGLAGTGTVAWVWLFGPRFEWVALGTAAVLVAAAFACQRLPVAFGGGSSGSNSVEVSDVAILSALVLAGPLWALAVAVPSVVHREPLRTAYSAAARTITVLAAGLAFYLFADPLLFSGGIEVRFVYAGLAAGLTYQALDAAISCGLWRLKYSTPFGRSLREMILPVIPSDTAAILTSLLVGMAANTYGPAAALALFCGAAGALASLYLIREHRGRVRKLEERVEHLERENEGMASSPIIFASRLVENLGRKDGRTARLAAASSTYAADTATELGLERARIEKLKVAALLQDVGLSGVPDEVLLTPPAKLNSVGREAFEGHPIAGERVLSGVPGFEEAARWVRYHHERADGTGYPDRLRGEWIPLEAKILSVTSAYAYLILDSPHGPALGHLDARRRLIDSAGTALDGEVVRTFLRVLDQHDKSYALASDRRFVLAEAAAPAVKVPASSGRVTSLSG